VSLGYLSEVERGRKEASSELLAAICAALETPLSQVFREVSDNFALAELQQDTVLVAPREPVFRVPAERVPASVGAPAAAANLDGVPAIDAMDVASVSDEFADHRSGFAGAGGSVRDITDMVPV
jgi:transcriptional regulator with XRE-family HTH domain